MIRFIVRIFGLALLAGAFAACVIDGAASIAAGQLSPTWIGKTLYWALPNKFPHLEATIRSIHPMLWDPIVLNILMLPTSLVLAVLGAGLLYVARKRPPPIGHSNRAR